MKVLTLIPRPRRLEYAVFVNGGGAAAEGAVPSADARPDAASLRDMLSQIVAEFQRAAGCSPEAVAIRVPFGGPEFRKPALAEEETLRKLEAMAASAPLHLPAVARLARCCGEAFAGTGAPAVVLVFETAFFASLPEREYSYGLDAERMDSMRLRRYGFHGLFHQAACRHAARRARERGAISPQRIFSIVLEPKPEAAAVFGNRPLTVTGGATPLEGIPGETSAGDLDPGIVLALSREKGWGPEQINSILTRESGLLGLTGRRITFEELFNLNDPTLEKARDVIRYRLLLACGAGIAAMSGLDGIVFSGRYAELGRRLGPWLASRLRLRRSPAPLSETPPRGPALDSPVPWDCFLTPLSRLLADAAVVAVLESAVPRRG